MICSGKELARYIKYMTDSLYDGTFTNHFPEYENRVCGSGYNDDFPAMPDRLDSLCNEYIVMKLGSVIDPAVRVYDNTIPYCISYDPSSDFYPTDYRSDDEYLTLGACTEEDLFQQSLVLDKWKYFVYEYLSELNNLDAKPVRIYIERVMGFVLMNCDVLELMIEERVNNEQYENNEKS